MPAHPAALHLCRARPRQRFFRTVNDECLHIRPLFTFAARDRAVEDFVWYYNHERPHFSLAGMTPVGRRKLYFRQAE
jgi:transposase InsO family protein